MITKMEKNHDIFKKKKDDNNHGIAVPANIDDMRAMQPQLCKV